MNSTPQTVNRDKQNTLVDMRQARSDLIGLFFKNELADSPMISCQTGRLVDRILPPCPDPDMW